MQRLNYFAFLPFESFQCKLQFFLPFQIYLACFLFSLAGIIIEKNVIEFQLYTVRDGLIYAFTKHTTDVWCAMCCNVFHMNMNMNIPPKPHIGIKKQQQQPFKSYRSIKSWL